MNNQEDLVDSPENRETVSLPLPKLDLKDKLYIRTYLHTLSHPEAHRTVSPGVKGREDNPWSRKENIKFHISLALQSKAEALSIDPNKIIERLYFEAIREGNGSNHSARIQALNILGKHLGMFSDEKKGDVYQINIVNYSPDNTSESTNQKELIESKDTPSIENPKISDSLEINITNYENQTKEIN